MDFNLDGIVSDKKTNEDFDVGIRDKIRTKYVSKGLCQPKSRNFPKDAAFCF